MSPFKSKAQQKFMYTRHPSIAKEFSKKTNFENLPEKLHVGSSVSSGALFKEELSEDANYMADGRSTKKEIISPETAEHHVKKEWNPKKNKFDYIYPSDLEKKNRSLAKDTMNASIKGDIPKRLKLSGPAEQIKGGRADNVPDSMFKKKDLKQGMKVEEEHSPNKAKEKEITKDHIVESKKVNDGKFVNKYYPKLKEMEKKIEAETADNIETAAVYESSAKSGDYKGGKQGRTWKWDDHKYRARIGPKGDYRYNYTANLQKVPHTEAVVERKMHKEQKREESRAAHEGGMVRLPNSGELQNPGGQASRPSAGFRGRAPSPRMAPQGKGRHMQNSAVKANDVNIKGMIEGKQSNHKQGQQQPQPQIPQQQQTAPASIMPGAGQNTQTQGAGNPLNQGQNMQPARQAMQGFLQNTMSDQAKAQGNVYDSQALGREDFNKQDSSLNPLSPQNLTPEQQQRFGQCHDMAKQMAMKTGGVRHTTNGRNAGFHSITINPDNTVYDYVLGINGMPMDRYLALVPYSFSKNP